MIIIIIDRAQHPIDIKFFIPFYFISTFAKPLPFYISSPTKTI